ncbi:MAG: sugar phosphate isomerase/epimerase family protein [Verrucomicrobiota bacterium]|jgi:sugar phosphate isomerase/epimerase
MHTPLNRRDFLKTAGLASVSSLAGNLNAQDRSAETALAARPRLLPGCCAYSYRAYLQNGRMTMEQFIVRAVELGVLGVDITTYWLKSTEPAYLASLRRFAYRQGMPFSGLAIGADLCQPDAPKRKETLETVRKWVDATELLGASHLRVFGERLPAGATEEQGIQWVAETMKLACEYAATKGVILGLESHGGISTKADNILEILRRVDSPYAGCNLDISNFPDNPYEQIAACLPFATHAHIRDFYGDHKAPLDLDRVWQLFAQSGYKGFMSLEYEGDEDALSGVPKLIGKIKALCRKYSSA